MYLRTRQEVLELLQGFVDGVFSFSELDKKFKRIYYREDWPILDSRDKDLCGAVLEKLGWIMEDPSDEEKDLGWMDFEEFREWLKALLLPYSRGEELQF